MLGHCKHSLLRLLSALLVSVYSFVYTPEAHSIEDYAIRLDNQRTLPTVKVTSSRSRGNSYSLLSLHMSDGGTGRLDLSRYIDNQAYLEHLCSETEDIHACEKLCTIYPNSTLCVLIFGTITVTGSRPTSHVRFDRYEIKHGKVVFISTTKKDENEKQRENKELEKKCKTELSHIFSAEEDFPFASVFDVQQSSLFGKPTEKEIETIDNYIKQLFNYTKPIMTTGIEGYNDGKPVDYKNGFEAHNSFYIDNQGNLTRGKNIVFGTKPGQVSPNFKNDLQFVEMLDSPFNELVQNLIVDFHTHPDIESYYIFPSSMDTYKFMLDKQYNFIDHDAMLAIGFISNRDYHLLLVDINDSSDFFSCTGKCSCTDPL